MDEHEQCKREMAAAEARIRALEAEIARKDEALRPFAKGADSYYPDDGDGHESAWNSRFRVDALRAARAALGPWVPTHRGDFNDIREVLRTSDGHVVYAFKSGEHGTMTIGEFAAFWRPLTPDEARAAVEGRS